MSHDKIKAAARERMAQTGEPYTAARRAVVNEQQPADGQRPPEGYVLRMSDEMHDWLVSLRDDNPGVARYVAQAVVALMRMGAGLGDPLVVSTAGIWPEALIDGQSRSYQEELERLRDLRRTWADAHDLVKDLKDQLAELMAGRARLEARHREALDAGRPEEAAPLGLSLAALQQQMTEVQQLWSGAANTRQQLDERMRGVQTRIDAARMRKEALKASYIAAESSIRVRKIIGDAGLVADDGQPLPDSGEAISATQVMIRDLIGQMERELDQQPWPEGLMELRPGVPDGAEIRIVFGVEPPGTALLIAALEGAGAVADQRLEAILLSAEMLHRVRAGQAPEASAWGYEDTQSFLAEFYPKD
jgi:hypothetical protein